MNKESQRDEIFIDQNIALSLKPQRGDTLRICRSTGAFF